MIHIETSHECEEGFDLEVKVFGEGHMVFCQLTAIFDKIYKTSPELFEAALLECQYTEDHT